MNKQLLDAYYHYSIEQVRAGILDHSLDAAILAGKTVEESIVDILRAAGTLPDGWDVGTTTDELVEERRCRAV